MVLMVILLVSPWLILPSVKWARTQIYQFLNIDDALFLRVLPVLLFSRVEKGDVL